MAVEYYVFERPSYLHLYLGGQVTAEKYFQCFAELVEDDAFYPAVPTLMEIGHDAEAIVGEIDVEEAEEMSEVVRQARADARYRIAIAGGPLDTRSAIAMAQSIVGNESEARVFGSVLEAYRWLFAQT